MRRIAALLVVALVSANGAAARQAQSPPPTPTPSPQTSPAQAGGSVAAGRSGVVMVDRQTQTTAAPRGTGTPDRVVAITNFIGQPGPSSWQNVKLDVKISDSLNADTHSKTVTLLCLDGNSGQVRSQSGEGLINIDTRPVIRPDGRIYVQLILEYRPDYANPSAASNSTASASTASGPMPNRSGGFSESLNLLVSDSKPMVASQSADPHSDRRVTVEITATVLK
jgi:hypothetical protein